MKVTFGRYIKGLGIVRKLVAGLIFVPPLLSLVVPNSAPLREFIYPPLGNFQAPGLIATMGFLLLTIFWVFVFGRSAQTIRTRVYVFLGIAFLVGVMGSIALYVPYVMRVDVAAVDQQVPVSIGFDRTDFARQKYPHNSDYEMLEKRGPWEPEIRNLWTSRSIAAVRIGLWFFYTLVLAAVLSVASLIAYDSQQKKP
jgi:hypothetical protein